MDRKEGGNDQRKRDKNFHDPDVKICPEKMSNDVFCYLTPSDIFFVLFFLVFIFLFLFFYFSLIVFCLLFSSALFSSCFCIG